ncbi:hypothetical protein FS800_26645, partial [Agrobacterium vitis]|nr:hypothetical protein [Allorhizobium ampelinum]
MGRGRLSGIELLPEECGPIVAWASDCWFPRGTEPVFPPRSEPPLSMVFCSGFSQGAGLFSSLLCCCG